MEDKQRTKFDKENLKFHPRDRANFLSKLCFCWSLPIFVKGYKKDLTESDLYKPLLSHESEKLGDQLETTWNLDKMLHKQPSLWRVIFKVFGREIAMFGVVPIFLELVSKMSYPLILQSLMEYYVPNQTTVSKGDAYVFACLLVLVSFVNVLITSAYMLAIQHLGMRIRVAVCSLMYRKVLRLSKAALEQTTLGQIITLMSNDVRRFNFTFMHLHNMWIAPIEIAVVLYLIYVNLGPSALSGFGVLIVFIPIQTYVGRKTATYRRKTAIKSDQRVRLMNEIICGIQVIKMYTWEKPFAKLIEKARRLEINQIRAASYLRSVNVSLMIFLSRISVFLCVLVYVLTGNALQAQYVYVVTSFYGVLRQALTAHVPMGITSMAETNVSIKRIQKFMSCDEVKKDTRSQEILNNNEKGRICMRDLSATWTSANGESTLKNVDFGVDAGETVAVVGVVGSGKSTMLQVVLKELSHFAGKLEVSGSISYTPQEPWIFASSIRQNILFGQEMEEKRYKEVVRACALERDFALFPYGDKTIVGERGVMLSGGQKARVSLARAVYKEADIYLLDDPLSAVDTHVGKQLFDDCILGYLKSKCVVLVTHQLQYLRKADRIYVVDSGRIVANGSYDQLLSSDSEFLQLLQRVGSEKAEGDSLDEDRQSKRLPRQQSKTQTENGSSNGLPLEVKEHRSTGSIAKRVYSSYFKAGGSWFYTAFTFFLFFVTQSFASGTDYFLTFWVNLEQDRSILVAQKLNDSTANGTADNSTVASVNSTSVDLEEDSSRFFTSTVCLYIYTFLIAAVVIVTLIRSLNFFRYCLKAAQNLHDKMFANIAYTTMRFFNTNPSGRILNRFAKDLGAIDEMLPNTITETAQVGISVLAITMVICSVNVWILIPTVIMFALFYGYRFFFLATSRDLKRIEGTSRSPVFSHTAASLQGLSTIRAFDAQGILQKEFDQHQDLHSSAFYTFLGCSRAFAFWLDLNCVLYIAFVILSFLFMGNETYGGNVGLAITQSIMLTGMLQRGMRQWSEFENQMTSVERVVEYTEVAPEPDDKTKKPPPSWPSRGTIEFRSVSMRYSPTDPYVLKNLCFKIGSSEKVGIVGRTGAGKSSLISALFRLSDIEGVILIDDINTKEISLNSLRSRISIIPQEPVLFSGTLRKNLDPFEEFDDPKLWEALDEVELKQAIQDLPSGLHSAVTDGGTNFSVGQRQLLCLARAVIRKNKILVLDEATANVDPHTDELIQETIRKKFAECTVLTIAHRLHTVMDSDKVLVMDEGVCVEMDHPHLLLQEDGMFHKLVMQTGKAMANSLEEIARKSYHIWMERSKV